jgi:2-O-methyltransferase
MSHPAKYHREAILSQPSPIEAELRSLFAHDAPLVIFDIGSCEGEDSFRYARLFPNARIYAFEPVPKNFALIQQALENQPNPRIKPFPYALSRASGEATLHLSSGSPPGKEDLNWDFGNKSSSLYPPGKTLEQRPWLEFKETISVTTKTLEDFCREQGVDRLDFVHLDVQGAELDVLAGAGPWLPRIALIWMEVEAIPLYAGQPLRKQVQQFMAGHGFRKIKDTVGKIAGDQLYLNRAVRWSEPGLFKTLWRRARLRWT